MRFMIGKASFKTGVIKGVTQQRLADEYGVKSRQLRYLITEAQELGLIGIQLRNSADGRQPSRYILDPSSSKAHRQSTATGVRTKKKVAKTQVPKAQRQSTASGNGLPSYTRRDKELSTREQESEEKAKKEPQRQSTATGLIKNGDIPQRRQPRTAHALRGKSQSALATPDKDKERPSGNPLPLGSDEQHARLVIEREIADLRRKKETSHFFTSIDARRLARLERKLDSASESAAVQS